METPLAKNHFEFHQNNDNEIAEIATYINYPTDFHIFDAKWLPSFPTKFVTVGATSKTSPRGFVQISQLNNDQLDVIKVIEKKSAFRCASFGASVRNASSLSVGDFHGNFQIFDAERFDFPVYDVQAHNGILNCLDGLGEGEGAEIVTGGQDGCIKVWDPRQGVPVVCISPVKKEDGGSGCRDCWTVTFADGDKQHDRVICAGFDNGDIKVIDLRILKERSNYNVGSGVCKLCCDKKHAKTNRLVAGTVDGSIHLFDVNKVEQLDQSHERVRVSESSSIWSINYLPQHDDIFATVGDSITIWRHRDSSKTTASKDPIELLTQIHLSSAGINCFDWNPDFRKLGLCGSFDQQIRILITSGL